MQLVTSGVYRLTGTLVGNVYLIEDPDGLTLIDTSIPQSAAAILRQVQALGRRPADVRRILITHAHPDHVGALPELKRVTGAQVIASAIERPVIEGKVAVPVTPPEKRIGLARLFVPPRTVLPPTAVDREVRDGEALPEVLGGLTVVATPGHAPGHLAFWHPARRLLFCGDVIFRLPNLRLPFSFFTVDMDENKRSIRKVAALEPAIVCFGHGRPLRQNAAAAIHTFAQKVGA